MWMHKSWNVFIPFWSEKSRKVIYFNIYMYVHEPADDAKVWKYPVGSPGGSTLKFLYVVRLQYCLYFCAFKYVQAIKQKGFFTLHTGSLRALRVWDY